MHYLANYILIEKNKMQRILRVCLSCWESVK